MRNEQDRIIEKECAHFMRFPIIALIIAELLDIIIPSFTAFLIGDMGEQILSGNKVAVLSQIFPFICAVVLIAFVTPFASYVENLFLTKYGFAYDAFLVERFIRMPMLSAQKKELGELMERLEEDSALYCFYQVLKRGRPIVMSIYLIFLFAFVYKQDYSVVYTIIVFVLAATPLLWANYSGKREATLKKEFSQYNEKRKTLEQTLYSSRQFYLFYQLSAFICNKLDDTFDEYFSNSGRRRIRFLSLSDTMDFFMKNGIRVLLIVVGSLLMAFGKISVGELLGGILLYPSISKWYGYGKSLLKNSKHEIECRERIALFYENEMENSSKSVRKVERINFNDIAFSYAEGKWVVKDMNREFQPDIKYRIEGANGSGKSTLLKLLSGIYAPQKGTITDEHGENLSISDLRNNVSFQEQDGVIFSGTVFDNLFIEESKRSRAEEILKTLHFEKGIDDELTESGENLSPGEKKKIILARSLLKDAPFLILDEPLNHLDVAGEKGFLSLLNNRNRGLIMVSHRDIPEIDFCGVSCEDSNLRNKKVNKEFLLEQS